MEGDVAAVMPLKLGYPFATFYFSGTDPGDPPPQHIPPVWIIYPATEPECIGVTNNIRNISVRCQQSNRNPH